MPACRGHTRRISRAGTPSPEFHFQAGGQGVWVARLAGALGADVYLATVLEGESACCCHPARDAGVRVRAVRGQTVLRGRYVEGVATASSMREADGVVCDLDGFEHIPEGEADALARDHAASGGTSTPERRR